MLIRYPWQAPTAREPREPISLGLGIAAITGFETVTGFAIGFEAASFVGGAILTAGLVGAQFLLAARPDGGGAIGNFSNAGAANSQEIRVNRRQPTPSRTIVYGRALKGGAMCFEQVKPPYLYHGWMVAAHEIEGFEQLYIARDLIAFTQLTPILPVNQTLIPLGKDNGDGTISSDPDYAANLRVSFRTGNSSQAIDPLLHSDFTSLESQFRQRGIATMVLRYKYPGANYNDFQNMWGNVQAPNPLVLVKGRKLYDPRDPTQIMWSDPQDLDEIAAAETTWKWSNNAALVQSDYLVQPYGGRILPSRVDYDKVADAANYDDELVGTTTTGELIRRHTIDGVVTLNQSPSDVLRSMLTANRGFVVQRAGTVWVSSSRPLTPVLTIHDGLLTGGIEFQGNKPKRDLVNRVMSRFIASEREYQQVDGPTLDREDLQETDQEILASTISLPFTLDYRRVERLQKAYLQSARLGKTLNVSVSLRALAEADDDLIGNVITFDSDLFSVANGDYRCLSMGLADGCSSLQLQLAEYDPEIERDWIPATDEMPFTVADLNVS